MKNDRRAHRGVLPPAAALFYPPVWKALALCAAAGYGFSLLHIPLPWMLGPLLAMAGGRIGALTLGAPRGGQQTGQWLIGTALGLYFTPSVLREVIQHMGIMLFAATAAMALAYANAFFVAHFARMDKTTAFFASVPGGAAEMSILGDRFGATGERVALAHSLRILLVVLIIPPLFNFSGVSGTDGYAPAAIPLLPVKLLLLLVITAAAGVLLFRLRLPNPWVLGPLFSAIVLTASEVHFSAMPALLTNSAQLLIGCSLGARFNRNFLRGAPRYVLTIFISVLLGMGAAASLGWFIAWWSGLSPATIILATAPGGVAEMCITAKVLHLGVPMVTAFHVMRVLVLTTLTGVIFQRAQRWRRRRYTAGSGRAR